MRILIADDHGLVREMMAALLERDGGMRVIQCDSHTAAMTEMQRAIGAGGEAGRDHAADVALARRYATRRAKQNGCLHG